MEQTLVNRLTGQFEANQKQQFTGRLLAYSRTGQCWAIYFLLGRIIWASGGSHRFRRWFRSLSVHASHIDLERLPSPEVSASKLWEYNMLSTLLRQHRVFVEPINHLIREAVLEILFEILQEATDFKQSVQSAHRIKNLGDPIAVMRPDQYFYTAHNQWTQWRQAGLISYSPNLAPVLKYPEKLRQQMSDTTYTKLSTLLTGRRSLRELSAHLNMNLLDFSQATLPFVNRGIIALNPVPDWLPSGTAPTPVNPTPMSPLSATPLPTPPSEAIAQPDKPLILCIDDSLAVCQLMEKIITRGGYRYLCVQDSFQALSHILEHKPDLIFLDLAMPVASGYEVCAQIRRIPELRSIPIIILTGNSGMVERVRARLVGASDFLAKPFEAKTVLDIANRYLAQIFNASMIAQDLSQQGSR